MNYQEKSEDDPERDRFIMSKGHSVPAQYVALAMLGKIPMDELKTIKKIGTRLQGHPDINKTPGVEAPTGSLGQGLSYANGIALAAQMDNQKFNIYVVIGDGEMQEGQIWEAAMTTSHYHLNNICVIVDRKRYQSQGNVNEMMNIDPLARKWEAFGWQTTTIDGHDIKQVCDALDLMANKNRKPLAIIANTIKGKGISCIEDTYKGHNYAMTKEEYAQAEPEILEKLTEIRNA